MIDWQIIDKSLNSVLTEAEKVQLEKWLQTAGHRELYEKIRKKKQYAPEEKQYALWRQAFERELRRKLQKKRKYALLKWGSVAAAVLFLCGGGWYMWHRQLPQEVQYAVYEQPDRSKVRLLTGNGQLIDLSTTKEQDTLVIDGMKVAKDQKMLAYSGHPSAPTEGETTKNQIEVPRGAEFCLSLSDGTRVWLNSDSRLSYPVVFTGNSREVELQGEAYFEVTHQKEKPFIVHAAGMSVKVLGTEFNINTRNTANIQTTLVKGKVEVGGSRFAPVILKPGEMASADIPAGRVSVQAVNVRKYTAWRQGEYFFEEITMEEMLDELALWYDVEVEFQKEELRKETFSGCLRRSESITSLLDKIEQTTYVHFSIRQKRIIVHE